LKQAKPKGLFLVRATEKLRLTNFFCAWLKRRKKYLTGANKINPTFAMRADHERAI